MDEEEILLENPVSGAHTCIELSQDLVEFECIADQTWKSIAEIGSISCQFGCPKFFE